MNTFFKHHPRRLYTWTSPDGKTRNQIDYILIEQRWKTNILQCKTLPGADCDTDHELLIAKFKSKIKKTTKTSIITRYDMTSIPKEYNIEIQNKFEKLLEIQEEYTPNELENKISDIFNNCAKNMLHKKSKKKKEYISEETMNMIQERRH